MASLHVETILRLAQRHTVISSRNLLSAGVPRRLLAKMAASGELQRVGRGLYTHPKKAPSLHQSLIEVAKRTPKAVVCLLSALQLHEIGTAAPFEVWMALPAGTHAPRIAYPPLRVVRLSGPAYADGIDVWTLDGVPVNVYNLAKTIVDCFKLRNKVGLDVALEALHQGFKARKVTVDELWRHAKINRMTNVMRPYLESLAI